MSSLVLASRAPAIAALALLLLAPGAAVAETWVWVDEAGVTHLTDDPGDVPPGVRREAGPDVDQLRSLWQDGFVGPMPVTPPGGSGSEEDRALRLLRGAVDDLRRGETARAAAALRGVLRLDPRRPEAHWHLALLDRQRGRYASAEEHLRAFLDSASGELAPWRASAERRLAALADERRLADASSAEGALELVALDTAHFRVEVDAALNEISPDFATTVMRYLEEARALVSAQLGATPLEPLGVVFYGKAAYTRAHRHRFSFQTVGFFDGRIHVASPAHPSGGLRSLLFHEYTHALFREQTGGDRPYWLNEGLAELVERRSRQQAPSSRSERALLRARIEAGRWLPLRRLAPSFSGLSDEDARAAYLESILAAAWLHERTDRAARARLLGRLSAGFSADQALHEAVGLDTDELDAAVREEVLAEFPPI
jgi:tetratricopeptide (TPR) repeat protein